MFLKVFICPMYFGGYNESLMALNGKFNVPACRGVADWTVNPPVLLFNFSISQETLTVCGNNMNVRAFHFKAIDLYTFHPTDFHNVCVACLLVRLQVKWDQEYSQTSLKSSP